MYTERSSDQPTDHTETPSTVTLFYSDYSGNCRAFMQILHNPTNRLERLVNVRCVNVDNQAMRTKILKKFFQVPAVVVVYAKTVSLYLGENAFDWLEQFEQLPDDDEFSDNESTKTVDESTKAKKTIVELAAEIEKGRK